jgi:hypothetical protein
LFFLIYFSGFTWLYIFIIMNPMRSTIFWDNKPKSPYNKDHNIYSVSSSRIEKESQRYQMHKERQELKKQHEERKQQKILEYEINRAQNLKFDKKKFSSRSKSAGQSPSYLHYRSRSTSFASEFDTTPKRKNDISTCGYYEK